MHLIMAKGDDDVQSQITKAKTTLHLHAFDVQHPGVRLFLSHVVNKPLLLQESLDEANKILYNPKLRKEWDDSVKWHQHEPRSVTIIVRSMEGVAYTTGKVLDDDHKEIHISAEYVHGLLKRRRRKSNLQPTPTSTTAVTPPLPTQTATPQMTTNKHSNVKNEGDMIPIDIEAEIRGVLVHELVHCLQGNGKGTCPGGLIEGIADWVRLQAKLSPPHWKPYDGGKKDGEDEVDWDAGYATTAFFLDWLTKRLNVSHLVPRLNQALTVNEWEEGKAMERAAGQPVDMKALWTEYCHRRRKE